MDSFDPKEFEAFKASSNPTSSSGGFDPEEFQAFKDVQSSKSGVMDKILKAFGAPDQLAGESVRTAMQGLPFRLPDVIRGIDVNNQYVTNTQPAASFAGELTGSMSGAAQAVRAALKGKSSGQAFQDEMFRPKNQPADIPGQVAMAFGAPEVANAPFNAAVKAGEAVAAPAGKLASLLSSLGTNVDQSNYKTIFKNPEGILPGSLEKASQAYEKALINSGIDPKVVNKERLQSLTNSEPYAFGNFKDLQENGTLAPEKALYSRQAIDKIYPIPNKKNASYRKLLETMKDSFNEVLNNSTPQIQEASKKYAIAKAGDSFKSALPLTSSGKPGFFRGAAMEEMVRRPIMEAFKSGDTMKALNALSVIPMVPAIAGGTTAAMGMASKPLSFLASNRILTSALLAALAKSRMDQNQTNNPQ